MQTERTFSLEINHAELVYALDALFDSLTHKLEQCYTPSWSYFRERLDIKDFHQSLSITILLYGRLLQLYQTEIDDPSFVELVNLTGPIWKMVEMVENAKSWDDMPTMSKEAFDEIVFQPRGI